MSTPLTTFNAWVANDTSGKVVLEEVQAKPLDDDDIDGE